MDHALKPVSIDDILYSEEQGPQQRDKVEHASSLEVVRPQTTRLSLLIKCK